MLHSRFLNLVYYHANSYSKGPTMYPCVVGHEIVGTAVRVGSKAQNEIK